jgi:hypothetical protein
VMAHAASRSRRTCDACISAVKLTDAALTSCPVQCSTYPNMNW